MSVQVAASALKFSDWSRYTSAQLAKRLKSLGIAPGRGKPRRQAQLNLWEMGGAWIPNCRDSSLTVTSAAAAAAAENRLVELYRLRISEARGLAIKYGIASAAEIGHTRRFILIKFVFVHEFMVTLRDNPADLPAPGIEAGPPSTSAAITINATASPVAPSTKIKPLEASQQVLRDYARPTRDSFTQIDHELRDIINTMELELAMVKESVE